MMFIKKIRSENDDKEYFLITSWEDDSAEIEIAVVSVLNFKCYKGLLAGNYVKTRSIKMRMPYKAYLAEARCALTHMNPDNLRFVYSIIESGDDNAVFEWKKFVEEEEIKILLGTISLSSSAPADLTVLLFSNLSMELRHLYQKVEQLEEDQNKLKTEKEDLLSMLEVTNEWKSKLETEMYGKFAVVLNSKKKKIKELKDELNQCMHANEKKQTANKQIEPIVRSENTEEKDADNSAIPLNIFSDEEGSVVSNNRIGRYISSNHQSIKKLKLEEFTTEDNGETSTNPSKKVSLCLSDPDSGDLFDEL